MRKVNKEISVIGAGVGGLAAACRAAKQGYKVKVYEKLSRCGGRANIIKDKGFKFDTGPSFVLMPDFYEEIFNYCGKNLSDYLDFKILDISYNIFYPDGQKLTIYRDAERTKEELEKIEPGSSMSYDNFLSESGRIYNRVRNLLYSCFSKKDILSPVYWPLAFKIKFIQSYWQMVKKYFRSRELCYAFTFESMFIGVSPFQAPAFYSIISYVDHTQKIFHPLGGMYCIPEALKRMAEELGAQIFCDSEIKRILKNKNKIILNSGKAEITTDIAVVNADYAYARSCLLGETIPEYKYSCSVFLVYLGLNKKIGGLDHHNLFFCQDLRKNLNEIFKNKKFSEDPSFYVHVPTVTDTTLAPRGKEIVYVLIPVPNLNGCKEDISRYESEVRTLVFNKISQQSGTKIEDLIDVEHRFYPRSFIDSYNVKYGATFGLSHTFLQSAFFRPPNYNPKLKGIYFVGASTQPGGGLPPVIASSKIVADLIAKGVNL